MVLGSIPVAVTCLFMAGSYVILTVVYWYSDYDYCFCCYCHFCSVFQIKTFKRFLLYFVLLIKSAKSAMFYFKNILLKKPKSFPWKEIIAPLKDMNIIFQSTKSISYHSKVRWITKDASEEFDIIIGRYDSVGERNSWIIHVGRS